VLCGDYQLLTPGLRTMPNNGEPTAPVQTAIQIATTTDLSKELVQLRKEVAELSKACNRQQRRNQSPAPQDKPENTIC
jgi:hypothetical protein